MTVTVAEVYHGFDMRGTAMQGRSRLAAASERETLRAGRSPGKGRVEVAPKLWM